MNHAVVSLLNGEPAKVRCRTCHNDHDYRHEQAPPPKVDARKQALFNQVLAKVAPGSPATPVTVDPLVEEVVDEGFSDEEPVEEIAVEEEPVEEPPAAVKPAAKTAKAKPAAKTAVSSKTKPKAKAAIKGRK